MRNAIALLLLVVASCCHEKPALVCPTLLAETAPPPVVTVMAQQPPCIRPEKAAKIDLAGSKPLDGGVFIPTDKFRGLVLWLAADAVRDAASDTCLEGR